MSATLQAHRLFRIGIAGAIPAVQAHQLALPQAESTHPATEKHAAQVFLHSGL